MTVYDTGAETAWRAEARGALLGGEDGAGARARIASSAVFAGAVVVIGIELLLSALGAGIGLGALDGGSRPGAVGAGAGVWLILSTVVAFVAGGFVAGRLAGAPTRFDGLLHGLTLWALTLIAAVWLVSSAASGVVSGAFRIVGGASSLVGQSAAVVTPQVASAAGVSDDVVQEQIRAYLAPPVADPAAMSPQDAQKAVVMELPNLAAGGMRAAEARRRIIPIIAAQQHVSLDEAARRFDDAQARFEQQRAEAVAKARDLAQASAAAASKAALLTFGALLIGAVAAGLGGVLAHPRPRALSL